jgi:hypothetical protein
MKAIGTASFLAPARQRWFYLGMFACVSRWCLATI